MTILEILTQVARRIKDPIPQSITTNDDTTNELLGCAEHAAARVFNDYNWRAVTLDGYITTAPGANSYPLPSDFDSMLTYAIYDVDSGMEILAQTPDEQLSMQSGNNSDTGQKFRLGRDSIIFSNPFASVRHLQYLYKSKNYVRSQDDAGNKTYKNIFTKDTDEFLINDDLLIAATIAARSINLQFEDAATRIAEYQELLEICKNKDSALFQSNPNNISSGLTARKVLCRPGGTF